MLFPHPFANTPAEQHRRELRYSGKIVKRYGNDPIPPFAWGAKELIPSYAGGNEQAAITQFVNDWFAAPARHLDHKNFPAPRVETKKSCYAFPSYLDDADEARFFKSKKPFWGNRNSAFIILPHWSPIFWKYAAGTAFIRNFFLPVDTFRYFPKLATEKGCLGGARYDVVGANIGRTIKRFWQDVLNIQFFARHLKENLGYQSVGIWAYSIGSPRGMAASLFSRDFDFLIMNFLAESFPQAVLNGISTQHIAQELRQHVDDPTLEKLWSPLSPGKYEPLLARLPAHTLLIQPKYDLVFGEENNRRMVELLRRSAPHVTIEHGNYGHLTYGEFDKLIPVIHRISQFIIRNY